jgi:protein O-GlcNAc transferase
VAHYDLGTLLAQRNRSDEAIAHFEKAIAIKPDSTESRNNLANALAHLNRLDQSIVELEKVLEVSRRHAEP